MDDLVKSSCQYCSRGEFESFVEDSDSVDLAECESEKVVRVWLVDRSFQSSLSWALRKLQDASSTGTVSNSMVWLCKGKKNHLNNRRCYRTNSRCLWTTLVLPWKSSDTHSTAARCTRNATRQNTPIRINAKWRPMSMAWRQMNFSRHDYWRTWKESSRSLPIRLVKSSDHSVLTTICWGEWRLVLVNQGTSLFGQRNQRQGHRPRYAQDVFNVWCDERSGNEILQGNIGK